MVQRTGRSSAVTSDNRYFRQNPCPARCGLPQDPRLDLHNHHHGLNLEHFRAPINNLTNIPVGTFDRPQFDRVAVKFSLLCCQNVRACGQISRNLSISAGFRTKKWNDKRMRGQIFLSLIFFQYSLRIRMTSPGHRKRSARQSALFCAILIHLCSMLRITEGLSS